MADEDPQAAWDRKHPKTVNAPPPTPTPSQNAAPTPTTVDHSDPQAVWDAKHPKTAVPDTDLENLNPWEKPADVPWRDYGYAKARKLGGAFSSAAEDVGKVYADDATFGLGTRGAALAQGQTPADYQAEVDAARQRVGASRYGIDAMAYLTSPLRWVGTGLKAEQLAQTGVSKIAPNLSAKIAKRVGDFVEGGTYAGAQSAGHGNDPSTVAADVAGGGILSTGFGAAAQAVAPWAKTIRESWFGNIPGKLVQAGYGNPEGTPAEIAAGPPPGAPPRTPEQYQDANQLNLWRSQNKYGMPPNQTNVSNYVTKVYGDDPAQWPAALRDLHEAAGQEGGPSLAKRVALQVGTNALAAGGQYLGVGFSPELSAILHPAVTAATDAVMPALGRGFSADPVGGALRNAYPALTGWSPELQTPGWRY